MKKKTITVTACVAAVFLLSGCLEDKKQVELTMPATSAVPHDFDMNGRIIDHGSARVVKVNGKEINYLDFMWKYCRGLTKTEPTCKKMSLQADEDQRNYAQGKPLNPRPFN